MSVVLGCSLGQYQQFTMQESVSQMVEKPAVILHDKYKSDRIITYFKLLSVDSGEKNGRYNTN